MIMNEQTLIGAYMILTGASEGLARSVLIHLHLRLRQEGKEVS